MPGIFINGLGVYVPKQVISNADLEKTLDTSDEWITTRTGIKNRHKAADDEITSDLAYLAAVEALKDAGRNANEVTHVYLSTATPDALCPITACKVVDKLNLKGTMVFDGNAACSGFVNVLQLANYTAQADPNALILVIAAEIMTRKVDWTDRNTCVLFGDGAGAVLVSQKLPATPKGFLAKIKDILIQSDGSLADLLTIYGGGSMLNYQVGDTIGHDYFLQMAGSEVFKHAVRSMTDASQEILERNNLSVDDIKLIIPHQANNRIIEAVGNRLNVPAEKLFSNVAEYGNTSSATLPIALADARKENLLPQGSTVLLTTFGGGFIWTSAILDIL